MGWYSGSQLVVAASCLGCVTLCTKVGTKSESCSALCPAADGGTGLVSGPGTGYANCAQEQTGRLTWQGPGGKSGYGPAIVFDASGGWIMTWKNTPSFRPVTEPATQSDGIHKLSSTQTRDLLARLAALYGQVGSLPHAGASAAECSTSLYFELGGTYQPITLDYETPSTVAPEMESVWSWFDQVLGADAWTNPRTYCRQ
jgi:hypothetical protein